MYKLVNGKRVELTEEEVELLNPTRKEFQDKYWKYLHEVHLQKIDEGLYVDLDGVSYKWDISDAELLKMSSVLSAATAGLVTAPTYWRTKDNKNVPMTLPLLTEISAKLYSANLQILQEKHRIKDDIIMKDDADPSTFKGLMDDYLAWQPTLS